MYRHGIVYFCLVIVHPFLSYGKVDTAGDPILRYLNVDPKTVMEHELVNIKLPENIHEWFIEENMWKDANVQIQTLNESKNINMWLHPRDSLLASVDTPVYFANVDENIPEGVSYDRQENAMKRIGKLFEDPVHRHSLVIGWDPDSNETRVGGRIELEDYNTVIAIRPLPADVVEEHLRKRRSIDNKDESALKTARHVALKIQNNIPDPSNLVKINATYLDDSNTNSYQPDSHQSPVNYSNSIYPKLFLHYDSTYFKERFRDPQNEELLWFLHYVLAFWNGVDLIYRQLEKPNIRLHIAGIAVATTAEATPYINSNMIEEGGKLYFNASKAFYGATKFFYQVAHQVWSHRYDIAVTTTTLNMRPNILGIGGLRGACKFYQFYDIFAGIALVHDNAGFSGIDVAVHEVAHTLGIDHDNHTVDALCHEDEGFVMAPIIQVTGRGSTFSSCSLRQLDKALQSGALKCTYLLPPQKTNLPKIIPGREKTLYEQCEAEGKLGYCSKPEVNVCVRLTCYDHPKIGWFGSVLKPECVELGYGAAPGSRCTNPQTDVVSKFCLQKKCVSLDEPQEKNDSP